MNIIELKGLLKLKNVNWTIPDNVLDDLDINAEKLRFQLGELTPPMGTLTARFPRFRKLEWDKIRVLDPTIKRFPLIYTKLLPQSYDWRNVGGQNWISQVKNQGSCGSCVAFAVVSALEAHRRIETKNADLNVDLSEAGLFFIPERQCNLGDPRYGWNIPNALDFMMDQGTCDELNYPYRAVNQNAELVNGTQLTLKITGYDSTTDIKLMKRWLCEQGPLVTSFTVYDDFFVYWNTGTNGVYSHVNGAVAGGHAVTIIGYDDNQSCWICKNSWGSTHGNDGTFRIAYNQCGINNRMYLIQDVYEVFTRDELAYNPNLLRIVDEGASGWLLTDGVSRMKMFDNKEDARNGLCIARRHNRHGFIGRDNPRTNRADYIVEYWAGSSGLPYETLTKVDSIAYNPANVVAEDIDADGWRLKEGNHWMLMAHDMNDALSVLQVVERYSRMCFIGRNNTRPNRKAYIMTYWE